VRTGASARAGTVAAAAAFFLWGLFPLYWKMLAAVPALEVVAHRTAWGFVAVVAWVTLRRRWVDARSVASSPGTIARLAGSAVLIALNWLLYIWAVAHDHVVEASLGYFINPLVNVLLGVLVLRERLSRRSGRGGARRGGVAVLTVGRPPAWIALALAVSFGLYGSRRPSAPTRSLACSGRQLLAPLAAGWLLSLGARGGGAFGAAHAGASALLVLGGVVTAVPLVLFALGARSLPLSTLGFLQYLSPSIQFLLAVLVFREPFTAAHAATFACIWAALGILTWDLRRRLRHERAAAQSRAGEAERGTGGQS
jgi:chloramphenicol-sensitive protein RarD